MENPETLNKTTDSFRTLRQVSLFFFFLLGSAHIISGLMASENLFLPFSSTINRILDIPFVLVGIIYGLTHTKLNADNRYRKNYILMMVLICMGVLGLMLYINLFLADKTL